MGATMDSLAGFCGPKLNYNCVSSYKLVVGDGKYGYNKIIDAWLEARRCEEAG